MRLARFPAGRLFSERPRLRQVRIDQHDEFLPHDGRRKLPLSCRFMDRARECGREHSRTYAIRLGSAANVGYEQRFVGLCALHIEAIMCATRFLAAWTLFQQYAVCRRMPLCTAIIPSTSAAIRP